jgi:uncharacterized membrane protein
MPEILRLLLGTIVLRPYVFAFLLVYLFAATAQIGWRRALLYIPLGYLIAWISEYSSIHWGIPYGDYYYIPTTLKQELWVAGVPFMDSLSYVFLAFCSYSTAIFLLSPVAVEKGRLSVQDTPAVRRSWRTLILGSFLFVFLDIIIDPVALQGHRWFLGQIYGYRVNGIYFGIPMSNFIGWLVVGLGMILALQWLETINLPQPSKPSRLAGIPWVAAAGPLLFVSVLLFNLFITFWIGELLLATVSSLLIFYTGLLAVFFTIYKTRAENGR